MITVNCRGLNNKTSRALLFGWFKFQKAHMILLQETKCSNQADADKWAKEWYHPAFFSFSPDGAASAGTAFLLTSLGKKVISNFAPVSPPTSHYGSVDLQTEGYNIRIHNFYAPSDEADRKDFFSNLHLTPSQDPDLIQFAAGDFNCVESPLMDRISSAAPSFSSDITLLGSLLAPLGLEDWWRIENPDAKIMTWSNGATSSRIDRWYSPESMHHNINSITNLVPPRSDHIAVAIDIQFGNQPSIKGPGFWKQNSKLFKIPSFRSQMVEMLVKENKKRAEFHDPILYWEHLKEAIKDLTQKTATSITKKRNSRKSILQNRRRRLTLRADPADLPEIKKITTSLQQIEKEETETRILRTHAARKLSAYLPTKSLASLNNSKSTTQFQALQENGVTHTSQSEMEKIAIKFYKSLYLSEPDNPVIQTAQDEILSHMTDTVKPSDHRLLNECFSLDEIESAVDRQPLNKSPGLDGIVAEFYQEFWKFIKVPFLEMVDHLSTTNTLAPSQKLGVLTLIFKKGDPTLIPNYRPIALLNTDFKIISKVFADRLNSVAQYLIHPDQSALKGRFIGKNTRLMADVIHYLEKTNKKGAVILIDQEKAFDRVRWSYLEKLLSKLQFPPTMLKWFRILYGDPTNMILLNNHLSPTFQLSRGVRQGDPSSPTLFALAIEPLANAIRKDPLYHGLPIPGSDHSLKLSLYADDLALFTSKPQDFARIRHWISLYELASDAKVNTTKSEGFIRGIRKPPATILNLNWLPHGTFTTYLGTPVGFGLKEDQIFQAILLKLQTSIAKWSSFPLPINTKIVITKFFLIPKVSYLINTHSPSKAMTELVERTLRRFIWNSSQGKVNKDWLHAPRCSGGLGLPTITSVAQKAQISFLRRYHQHLEERTPLSSLTRFFLKNLGDKLGLRLSILISTYQAPPTCIAPRFYHNLVKTWQKLPPTEPKSSSEILSQPIWCNPFFMTQPDTTLAKKGVIRILDLWNKDAWMTAEGITRYNKVAVDPQTLTEIINAIPLKWKVTLERNQPDTPPIPTHLPPSLLRIEKKPLSVVPNSLINKALLTPTPQIKPFLVPVNWKQIWEKTWPRTIRSEMNMTYYLFLHQAHYTGEKAFLKGWPPIPLFCSCGRIEDETHMMWHCPLAQPCWKELWKAWRKHFGIPPAFSLSSIIKPPNKPQFIQLHRLTLHHIWTSRCSEVYGKEPRVLPDLSISLSRKLRTLILSLSP